MKAIKDNLNDRIQSYEYASMETFLKTKKYDQKIIKLETFIDDIYGYEEFEYKQLIQTEAEYSSFGEDYLQFKYLLVFQ